MNRIDTENLTLYMNMHDTDTWRIAVDSIRNDGYSATPEPMTLVRGRIEQVYEVTPKQAAFFLSNKKLNFSLYAREKNRDYGFPIPQEMAKVLFEDNPVKKESFSYGELTKSAREAKFADYTLQIVMIAQLQSYISQTYYHHKTFTLALLLGKYDKKRLRPAELKENDGLIYKYLEHTGYKVLIRHIRGKFYFRILL